METETRSQKTSFFLTSSLGLLTSALLFADAPDKLRDLTKARQAEHDRAVASVPVVKPAEIYRRYFAAMKAGRFAEAAATLTDESLRQMKAVLVRALREAPLNELAGFIRNAGFKSAAEIQLSAPSKVFTGWMRSGWRVQGLLQRFRQNEITSTEEAIRDDSCDLAVEFKLSVDTDATSTACPKETVTCERRDRVWRLKLEIPLEGKP